MAALRKWLLSIAVLLGRSSRSCMSSIIVPCVRPTQWCFSGLFICGDDIGWWQECDFEFVHVCVKCGVGHLFETRL